MNETLKPCPFCGHQPDEDNLRDSVYPLCRDGTLWQAGCVGNEGGCDANVLSDSREGAIEAWNRRTGEQQT